jgi:hypothetical protein
MIFTLIENGVISEVQTSLPISWDNGTQPYPIRRMWGKNRHGECNALGWYAAREVTPVFDPYTSKLTAEYDTALEDGLPVATYKVVALTDDEQDDKLFEAKSLLRVQVKQEGVSRMQKPVPQINTFDEVALTKLMWDCLGKTAQSKSLELASVLANYDAGLEGLLVVDSLATAAEINAFNVLSDVAWVVSD